MNLWRELPPGPRVPEVVYRIVEIPKGSRNKHECQEDTGVIKLDRVLYSSIHYPGGHWLDQSGQRPLVDRGRKPKQSAYRLGRYWLVYLWTLGSEQIEQMHFASGPT